MATATSELRVELPVDELAVLDGYCNATAKTRTVVVRQMIKDWSDRKLHEAVSICRVAGVNPATSETGRQGT